MSEAPTDRPARSGRRRAGRTLAASLLLWLALLAAHIVAAGRPSPPRRSDVAIVLGAAVRGAQPSPVFAERIRHGVELHRKGLARELVLTGGYGVGQGHAESLVARRRALSLGVPAAAIAVETRSRTTRQNLVEARRLMRARGHRTALVVSDPLHMARALRMADDLGIDAAPAPTPTSRYRSWRSKLPFLLRELWFYHHYLLLGE